MIPPQQAGRDALRKCFTAEIMKQFSVSYLLLIITHISSNQREWTATRLETGAPDSLTGSISTDLDLFKGNFTFMYWHDDDFAMRQAHQMHFKVFSCVSINTWTPTGELAPPTTWNLVEILGDLSWCLTARLLLTHYQHWLIRLLAPINKYVLAEVAQIVVEDATPVHTSE